MGDGAGQVPGQATTPQATVGPAVVHVVADPLADSDRLSFWLETVGETGAGAGVRTREHRPSVAPHPAAAPPQAIAAAVGALFAWPPSAAPTAGPAAAVARRPGSLAVLYLPSIGHLPQPSPDAVALGAVDPPVPGVAAVRLRPWRVPTLALPTDLLATPLWRAPARSAAFEGLALGSDARWLGRLARLAAAYWLRGAVVPRVDIDHTGVAAAHWLALLDDADLRPELEATAAAMPVALLAARRPTDWTGQLERWRWRATVGLLSGFVDALARFTPTRGGGIRRAPPPRLRVRRVKRQTTAWTEIARSLGGESPLVAAAPSEPVRRVAERLAEWQAPAHVGTARLARLALRLEPATDESAGEGRGGGVGIATAGTWRLEASMALLGDALQAVPLGQAWAGGETRRRAAAALGVAEGDLARAADGDVRRLAAMAPELARRLLTGAGRTVLTPLEALEFLRRDGPALRRAGFAVTVPAWWRADARRRLRVEVRATLPAGGRGLGLEGLVDVRWRATAGAREVRAGDLMRVVHSGGGLLAVGDGWVEVSARDARALARLLALAPDATGRAVEGRVLDALAELSELAPVAPAAGEAALDTSGTTGADADDAGDGDREGEGVDLFLASDGWLGQARSAMDGRAPLTASALAPIPDLAAAGLRGALRPYQEVGARWLWSLAGRGLGACLADDMGLGKSVQAIALIVARAHAGFAGAPSGAQARSPTTADPSRPSHPSRHALRSQAVTDAVDGPRPVLLVCPTSVLTNWQREFARFAPDLRVLVRHGQGRGRDDAALAAIADADVVLTSYALVWRDQRLLGRVAWDGVILDEAQAVKNPATRASRSVRRLQGRYRLALTGTPIETRLLDLWSIFQFLNPGYLGSLDAFQRRFVRPVEERADARATRVLGRLVAPFVLRRLKSDPRVVADLPDKVEMRELCPLTREQARLYQAVVDDLLATVGRLEGMARRGAVLTAILRMKQILNHPAQFLGEMGPLRPERSGKVVRIGEIVSEALSEGDRLLLFTQFVAFGRLLGPYLARLAGTEVPFLHGGLTRPERDRAVSVFQADGGPPVLLLSLRAGGVGLNLTRANRVLLVDRWWNPAVEAQAADRAHRIGQRERVMVHKMVVAGTVEERVDALIEERQRLAERVVGQGEGWIAELDDRALADLLRLRADEVEA